MELSETYVIRDDAGGITDYVFIDPSRRTHYRIPDRDAFEYAVSFSITSLIDSNYPVVFDDLTTSDGRSLEKTDYALVPAPVKRRLVAWLKVQPQPAAGPAGPPANPLTGPSTSRASGSAGSDRIKAAIVREHPDTRAGDWKRRTRTKDAEGVHRRFEHADGRIVDTVEKPDGAIGIHPAAPSPATGTVMHWPEASYGGVEIFISGPRVDELAPTFDFCEDNPDLVALFRHTGLLDGESDYNGDGCDRIDVRRGVLSAAIDGTSPEYVSIIVDDCRTCAERNPDLSYMVAGSHPIGDDGIQRYDVLFLKGFDAGTNPMRRAHGRFYAEYVVRGI